MTTLQAVELGVLGPLQVRQGGAPVAVPGAKPRAILTMLGLHGGSIVAADTLVELLWGEDPPRTAAKALQTHISSLRRALGDGFVLTAGAGWTLAESDVDASRYKSAARLGRDAATAGDTSQAVARFEEALALWRGVPELPDGRRGTSEKTRWIEGHAALVEDRADALLATGRAAEVIGDLEAAVAEAPLRERRWGQLMLALYRAGRQGEALGAYQRARSLLVDELGVDPGPELRRLEAAIVAQDASLDIPVAQNLPAMTRAVTFFLTDIEGSTAAWEADAGAMGVTLARHDELVEQVVTSRGGRLIKTRGEGDATFSVFERPSAAAAAAIELQDAIVHEPWALREPMRVRVALHTGEAELRDGDYFGRAVNRAARLRSLAEGGQILCSGATAELVIDSLSDDVVLNDLGMRQLRNLARPEHVFELRLETADEHRQAVPPDEPIARPSLPAVLAGHGPFVGRGHEIGQLFSAWQTTLDGGTNAALIAGEPGVGKTRLAGEWSRQAYDQGALVIYGRCDEDLGAAYQPFAEALRSLVPCVGSKGLRGLRGVEALLALVPGLTDELPDLAAPTRADPDTERYALFDAVVALLGVASASAPVVLILDDLHWAAKPTLLLLRHLLRFGDQARVQIIGTYRSTDLDRSHPLAAMLADLHRDGTANRIQLSGLDEKDVTTYVAEAGYDDEELARALASVTGGNPFFLIEALRHVDESGGHWDPSTLPQGVREAVSRRLSRLPAETNKALAAAAVVGSRFALELVERVVDQDLVDAFDEASKAGIIIEEHGGHYRFNHALVRQSLLAELASVRRMRLHQRIAATLETQPGADDELLAELAYHYFECAWAGNAAKAVDYCRRAADQAMARLGYEGAAELYDRALHALEEIDDELPDRDEQASALLVARCEALLAAGDVASAAGAVAQLQGTTADSARLAAWATCFDGELSMLVQPGRLDEIEAALGAAAAKLAELDDAAGEAKAHTVRASCLARLGRVGDCEIALDDALSAARRAGEHRRVNAVLAGAPLAALWGPNPVPRAGGRCLDVVRLLRITTDSPAVEATSTRCQAVLEAFRGRAATARRMIDSARRTVTELGLRHALLEVEQFAGIVELVADDPAAAEPHLRQAYNGFRRMGLDADTAETAALLGRTCLALGKDTEADELCTESERLAGHALKPSIAWRTLRAQLLSRRGDHDEARQVAEAAVALAERTDALVDHGDACSALATVLGTGGNVGGSRAAAERAVDLYERKGAAALAEKARGMLGERAVPPATAPPEPPVVEVDNAAVRVGERVMDAIHREAWDEVERLFAPTASIESRRKIVGFALPSDAVRLGMRHDLETGAMRIDNVMIAARGERLALSRLITSSPDASPGAPQDELLQLYAIDEQGRVAQQVWFDVEDIDAAIAELDAMHARFEEEATAQRLENAASQAYARMQACFMAGDWDGLAGTLTDDIYNEDRRRVVNLGVERGRDAALGNVRRAADLGVTQATSNVVAVRGERLVLTRARFSQGDENPDTFHVDVLQLVEVDADERIVALVMFDPDDFDAAIAELDARYLAGEAAAHAHAWSMLAESCAAFGRQELPAVSPDSVFVDHRRAAAFGSTDLATYIRAGSDQHIEPYIVAVHRLSDFAAVCSYAAQGVSDQGFDAEWQGVHFVTIEGDTFNRCEFFDEADLDTAIAKFDQLSRPARGLENTASQAYDRFKARYAARDWHAVTEMLAVNVWSEDRRRVVNSGLRQGRDAMIAELLGLAETGIDLASEVVATRGARLVLNRIRAWGHAEGPDGFNTVALDVIEIDADERFVTRIVFDLDDFDSAIAELDRRYLAGEAAPYAQTWTLTLETFAALNRRELPPTTPDWVNVDHRPVVGSHAGEVWVALRAVWELVPEVTINIEAVHQLSDVGTVLTFTGRGVSGDGFDAEWRDVTLITFEGDLINRGEVFAETDLAAALAKFEQLSQPAPQLENAASRVYERSNASFAAQDWEALAETFADDISTEDRRRVVGVAVQHGRDTVVANTRAIIDFGMTNVTSNVIATRGNRLILSRARFSGPDEEPGAFHTDVLIVLESNSDNRIAAHLVYDVEDFDAAIAELDSRYLAGEAAAHADTWSVVTRAYAAANRHELPATTPDLVNVDHRRLGMIETGGLIAYLHDTFDDLTDMSTYVAAVHRLTDVGAVITHVGKGTSGEGFDAEWRLINVATRDGDRINRTEVFDEVDIDAALARFDELQPQPRRVKNTASQVYKRFLACYVARDWDAVSETLADDILNDDRRRVVSAGVRRGRDATIASMRASAALGAFTTTLMVIATRGERLALSRELFSVRDQQSEELIAEVEVLGIVEIDAHERIVARIALELDDFDAAIAELDTRYLAGEAAVHADTWSVIAGIQAAVNRREVPPMTANPGYIDHRPLVSIEGADLAASIRAIFEINSAYTVYVEAVHRLDELGAVYTQAHKGTSHDGFDAEWRIIEVQTVEGDLLSHVEVFDEADLDAALARFEELHPQVPRLENTATRVNERFSGYFTLRDWVAIAQIFATYIFYDDRRRVVNGGSWQGRDLVIENMRAITDFTIENLGFIAIRGERLCLSRWRWSNSDRVPETFYSEVLCLIEVDTEELIAGLFVFDTDDFDAAFAELDARYLAGEAAAHSQTWTTMMQVQTMYNRREIPPTTKDWVNTDHRRGGASAPHEVIPFLRATFDVAPNLKGHIEAVHRLSNFGAVVTEVMTGTSQEGFDAEWREIGLFAFDGDLTSRFELFDETDLDAALATFDELRAPAGRLENAAIRMSECLFAGFAAGEWDSIRDILADDFSQDDRRRVVGAGVRHGRDEEIADLRAAADLWTGNATPSYIATRGERLVLMRLRLSFPDQGSDAFLTEVLGICEITADERIVAAVLFEFDDIDAAFAELDARYLAGEAAAHADTWSVMMQACAALNRREIFATTADFVDIDHRSLAPIGSGDLKAYMREALNDGVYNVYIEAVHRLSDLGAVVTLVSTGTSQEGFAGEWRMANIFAAESDLVSRVEIFNEADLDAALARFDELRQQTRRLENAASQVDQRFSTYFAARDWDAVAEILSVDMSEDDRLRVVNSGIRHGRDAQIASARAIADVGVTHVTSTVIAIRGERLALGRYLVADRWGGSTVLYVCETDAENRIVARVVFDLDDIDAAFDELDARYLAGEAAAHSHTWSVMMQVCAALNRREVFGTTPDFVDIDHRSLAAIGSGDLEAYLREALNDGMYNVYIEAVHRLSDLGAVVTLVASGTSQEGFDGEWRGANIFTVEGDLISRCEGFDEADLDAALGRFEDLQPQTPLLENAASQVGERFLTRFAAREWEGMAELLDDDYSSDDRRRVVGAGVRHGRDAQIADLRAIADLWITNIKMTVIATRGERLVLTRTTFSDRDQGSEAFLSDVLDVGEINADERYLANVSFDPNDIDAAFEELDARYLAGEAAAYQHTWSAIAGIYAAFNRHELSPTTPDWVNTDHRRGIAFAPGDMTAYIRAGGELTPDTRLYVETVHRLSNLGAVVTQVMKGTSRDGFDAEWQEIGILTLDGDLISRCELFDETELDAALARFDELDQPPSL